MSYEFFDHDDCNRDDSGSLRRAALLSSVALFLLMGTISAGHAQGVAAQPVAFSVPAQPLGSALTRFADQANLRLLVPSNIVAGKTSRPVSGSYAPEAALAQLLAGTGLSFSFSAANTVTVTAGGGVTNAVADAGAPEPDGSLVLDTITVRGGQGAVPANAPYETAAPTANISGQNIERFRGSSPADMFRSTPGVMSGEARNGAGSIDPNIRGMQGFGRVATTIDGAENAATIYQGYQGVSNRTFVDPDFISNIDVNKGADASSWGNAGSIAMTTVGVDDIVMPGKTWGIRVKGEMGGNTSSPDAGARSGYLFSNPIGSTNDPTSGFGTATPSSEGMDRPSFLTPTQGSGSVVAAVRQEDFDLVAGYAQRKRGNYHAGTNGPHASPVNLGPQPFCYSSGTCPDYLLYRNLVENGGIANYRAGEEVLNTQSATESWLTKLTARIGDDQTLQLGYNGFRSETGDILASRFAGPESQAMQGSETTGTSVDSYTARYRWNPEDNDLIDLKTSVYWTHLEVRNPIRGGRYGAFPIDIGLPRDFRVGSDTDLWGGDVSNLSKFYGDYGDLDLTYGLSYRAEDTQGSLHANVLEAWLTPRDAIRQEAAAYTKAAYEPFDWLTLNAGLRYSHFWSKDRFDPYDRNQANYSETGEVTSDGGFSPSVGVTFEPFDGAQFYVNYSNTMRAPSIFETVSAFNSVAANADVTPERSSNWEIGTNLTRDSLVADGDRAMVKVGYFNWDVDNYIARSVIVSPSSPLSLQIANIDRAKFSGLEFSGRYENGGFSADLAANYFLNVEYCRTADTCGEASLYGDYATNHVQPEYNVSLTLSQKLFEDRLTLGGRVTRVGPRAIDHGDVTAQGAQAFISPVEWKPYTLVDTFAEYKLSDSLTAAFRVENLFDRFYVDPLSLVTQPGPGRTYYASLTGTFGGDKPLAFLPSFGSGGERTSDKLAAIDWTGFYVGVHAGGTAGDIRGTTTALYGDDNTAANRESANLTHDGGLFGVQGGYNWQLDNGLVLGVEADYSKTYISNEQKIRSLDPGLAEKGYLDASVRYDIDWTASLRPRVGYAFGNGLMAYATGGVALAHQTQWRDQYISDQAYQGLPLGNETSIFSVEKASATRAGYVIGGGLEYALGAHWSIKGDYTYSRFPSKDLKFKDARKGTGKDYTEQRDTGRTEIVPPPYEPGDPICDEDPVFCQPFEVPVYETIENQGSSNVVEGRNAATELDAHAFKIGLNYRF